MRQLIDNSSFFSQRGTKDALQAIGVIVLAGISPAHPKYHKQYQTKGN
jgi:hypothetical protein